MVNHPASLVCLPLAVYNAWLIAPSFDSMLVPQAFVEKQHCCSLLLDKKLIICNHAGKQAIKQLIASEPTVVSCTIPAINVL